MSETVKEITIRGYTIEKRGKCPVCGGEIVEYVYKGICGQMVTTPSYICKDCQTKGDSTLYHIIWSNNT
jgi:hypothetical protein